MIRIDIDPGDLFKRTLNEIERSNLPFALQQTANRTGEEMQRQWKMLMQREFDNPVSMTLNAVKLNKARYTRGAAGQRIVHGAEVFIRDQAPKGTPPAKYLLPQADGGIRRHKGLERGLQRGHYLRPNEYAVPAKTAPLDAHGNIQRGVVQQILSQLKLQSKEAANESAESRAQRYEKQQKKFGRTYDYFALRRRKGRLRAGVYERSNDKSRGLRMIFHFTKVIYQPRIDLFEAARKTWKEVYPFFFERELKKAVENSKLRGRK